MTAPTPIPHRTAPLRDFVVAFAEMLEQAPDEPTVIARGSALLGALVARDDWLPADCAQPHPQYYQQYLLHADSAERFSVVAFVWGPGQATPVHDHTVWGLIGMLRGAEFAQAYTLGGGAPQALGAEKRLEPGDVDAVSPTLGDVHRVRNAFDDRVSISIHVYGGNIGAILRHVYGPDGQAKGFVSGYANDHLPNIWHRPGPA